METITIWLWFVKWIITQFPLAGMCRSAIAEPNHDEKIEGARYGEELRDRPPLKLPARRLARKGFPDVLGECILAG
jgi:hypothetical protein